MRLSTDPAALSPDQRRAELVRIMAVGVLRLRKAHTLREVRDEPASNSPAEGLDVSGETVLSVESG